MVIFIERGELMNIIVCVKQTPDTESIIKIDSSDKTRIVEDNLQFIINPYDEYAIEEALLIKEELGEGNVTVITIGPERAQSSLRDAYAMGVDEVLHIQDDSLINVEPLIIAKVLSEVIKDMDYDLILCGKQAVDDDSSQVPAMLSEHLNIPQIQFVTNLDISDGKLSATQEIDGGSAVISASLPAVISCQKGLNEPRYPSLRGKMKAKKLDIPVTSLPDMGISTDIVTDNLSRTMEVEELTTPPPRSAGEILEGEPEEIVETLIAKLKDRKVL